MVIGLGAMIWSGWRDVRTRKKWDIFLCHHKGGGGALARYLKIMPLDLIQEDSHRLGKELGNGIGWAL